MALTKTISRMMFAGLLAFALVSAAGCGGEDREEHKSGGVWLIHATDPHIFLYTAQDLDTNKSSVGEAQQKGDEKALSDMLKNVGQLRPDGRPPAFLLLTGDLGVEPCSIPDASWLKGASPIAAKSTKDCLDHVDKQKRDNEISGLANLLGQSPIRDIYLVAGNNDIPNEDADAGALSYFNDFMDEVQKRIAAAKKDVLLHNLTRCYVSGAAGSDCIADIAGTPYRLIGFPSYSFKNHDTGVENLTPQEKQFAIFKALLDDAGKAGKKVLVVSHIPEMDDPYTLAQQRYAGGSPADALDKDPSNSRDVSSTWNVRKKLLDDWEMVLASDAVAGVLAGHLHDSHREIYRQPYAWSNTSDQPRGFRKLYLAPPLSVKSQDTSPIQARGFSLVHLTADRIEPSLYWYNSETGTFRPDDSAKQGRHQRGYSPRIVAWLWHLADSQDPLDRLAVLLIAFLAAFLTVIQIFQIPPAKSPLGEEGKGEPTGSLENGGGAKTGGVTPAYEPSPFSNNFGKTVIAGLGGLAAETVLKSFENKPTANDKEFYVICFIIFFFGLLISMAAIRAAVEAFRARFSMVYQSRPWKEGDRKIDYWFWKTSHWFVSWRFPLLAFIDTFVNLIQGKNQTRTTIFTDKIVEQQRNVVRVAEVIRLQLNELILERLSHQKISRFLDHSDVRVNISVLSADLSNVFYIATAPGSATKTFLKTSVAWVSVFTGKIRWYLTSYKKDPTSFGKIVLFDNSKGKVPGGEQTLFLKSYYQAREDDYEAFVVFPVPWPARSFGESEVKGAIHISFHKESEFRAIWNFQPTPEELEAARTDASNKVDEAILAAPEDKRRALIARRETDIEKAVEECKKLFGDPLLNCPDSPSCTYQKEDRMLKEWCDVHVRSVLQEAVAVLGEVLHGFNESVYRSPGGSSKR